MKNFVYKLSIVVAAILLLCGARSASASHLRGTSLSWSQTGNPGEVQFTVQYSQRTTYGGCIPSCTVGSQIPVQIFFGDGMRATAYATITSVNTAEDWLSSVGTVVHTYAGAGPYTAYYLNTARLNNLVTGENQYVSMQTTVTPRATPLNHSPVISMPAIVAVPLGNYTGFALSASDADQDPLTYRLATAAEMYNISSFLCVAQQPPGLTVDNMGRVNWDTTQIASTSCGFPAPKVGDLWPVQFMVEDHDANGNVKSKVPLDVILKFVSSAEPPPTISLSNPGPITVAAGTPLSFTVTGDQAYTPNGRVTLNATGLPVGATATNLNQMLLPPVQSTVNWTPTARQIGTHVLTFSVTNDTMEQALASVTINVTNLQPPVLSCPASLSTPVNAALNIPVSISDPQADAVTVNWSVDGTQVQTTPVAASNAVTPLSLSQTFSTVGPHKVSLSATDTDNQTAGCTVPVNVTASDQTISFPALSDMAYGAPDVVLMGTASSGLAVSYAVSGSCTLVNGAVHATAVGSCSVTATQAGNASYNAAPAVTQSFNVTPATLTVTAANATRPYGAANPAFSGTVAGVVNGDQITATYSTTATSSSDPGTYAIVPAVSGAALANYTLNAVNGTLTISKANQTILWATPAAIVYGTPLSAAQLNATVTGSGPAAAGALSYTPGAGAVLDAGVQTLTATAAATADYNAATATVQLTVNKAQPVFSGLTPQTIVVHTASVTFNGTLAAPTGIPAGQPVSITLNGVTQSATLGANGSFSATFNSSTLPVAANGYTVSYSYAGAMDFLPASATSQLTVTYAVCKNYDVTQAKMSGSTYPIKVTVCDANGNNAASGNTVLTGIGWGTTTPAYTPLPDAGNSNGNGTFRNTGGSFMWNLKTTGMSSGAYNVFFNISGDPVMHSAPFVIR